MSVQSLTYESIFESFVRQKSFKCHYDGCDKGFATQSRLDLHISKRHAIDGSAQSGKPIGRSSHVKHQSLSAALDGIQQIPIISTADTSPPLIITTTTTTSSADRQSVDIKYNNSSADIRGQPLTPSLDVIYQTSNATTVVPSLPQTVTTSSADSQLVDIIIDNNFLIQYSSDSDSDIELIGRVPAPKRPARNRSPVDIKPSLIDSIPLVPEIPKRPARNRLPVDIKPSLIDSIPLVPEIVNKAPEAVITLTSAGDELIRDIAPGIRVVKKRKALVDPRLAAKTTRTTAPDLIPCSYMGCRQTFNTQSLLSTHMQSVHSWGQLSADQRFPCDKCHLKYSTELALHNHQALAHPKPTPTTTEKPSPELIPCPYIACRQTFTSQSLLSTHLQSVHSNERLSVVRCHICQLKYTKLLALNRHQALAHPKSGPPPVSTPVPNPKPSWKRNDRHHCPYAGCYMKYHTSLLLFGHMQLIHSYGTVNEWSAGEPSYDTYLCDKCHLKYRTQLHVRLHQALAHPMPPELNVADNNNSGFTCDTCHLHLTRIVPFMAHVCTEHPPVPTPGRHIRCDGCGDFERKKKRNQSKAFISQKQMSTWKFLTDIDIGKILAYKDQVPEESSKSSNHRRI
ncbi:unnamed protein product [Medioppia subpectinata]|uniref:C2H2-type domain-containing protein n=1 Tax=Medioppia subpectinata TaxID=1979941 RepID=A0A7R9KGG0_9ACAR|nr:unnamed protein product [Medioppia subpectinata]CAG2101888.1 unnamed protein product [Medioppia subpectinata]